MTEKKKIELEVPKEIYEVGEALSVLLESIAAHKEGGISASEIPAIISESLLGLIAALNGANQIPVEVKEQPVEAIMGALIPVAKGVQKLLK